ncbi:MAG: hypothetical protein QOH06_16 [Acidobacteriota bacterium]|jgi:hypothetical protein|nr:hypothetical protein [Acidobacteriota bacterium]
MATPTTSQADFVTDWRFTINGVDANPVDLAAALDDRSRLENVLVSAEQAKQRQKYHQAQFQQATRDLEDAIDEGRALHTKIRNFIRAVYGLTSEKLVEFKLKPRRSKKKPSQTGPTLPETAAPETDGTIQK